MLKFIKMNCINIFVSVIITCTVTVICIWVWCLLFHIRKWWFIALIQFYFVDDDDDYDIYYYLHLGHYDYGFRSVHLSVCLLDFFRKLLAYLQEIVWRYRMWPKDQLVSCCRWLGAWCGPGSFWRIQTGALLVLLFYLVGIPVDSDHAIAAYFAYFAKMRISHIFPHIVAFSKFRIFIYAFRMSIYA